MTDWKIILGIAVAVLSILSFVRYFHGIIKGQTRPHAFSWLIWALLTGIGFAAQVVGHGGAGSLALGATSLSCLIIGIIGLTKRRVIFKRFDWFSLGGAALALILWIVTKNPLASVILITITDAFGFAPTFRKGYEHPDEETASSYGLSALVLLLSLFALDQISVITVLYPIAVIIMDASFTLLLIIRRRILAQKMVK